MRGNRRERARARFQTTHWSVVLAAGDRAEPGYRAAIGSLCETYWYPLYAYVRRRGHDPEAAEDLVQGFFSSLLERGALRVADPERGRFRSFLLTSMKHYMANERQRGRALKRGGGLESVSLDFIAAEARYRREPTDERTPERFFERRWALALLEATMRRLREEADRAGTAGRFETLSRYLTGEEPGKPYGEVASNLGISEAAVKVAVHRLRRRYGQLLREEVSRTVDDPARVDEEIRRLFDSVGT